MSDKLIDKIKTGEFNRKALENLYANAERLNRIDVLEAARAALKEIDTRSYSKRFIKPIRDKIQEILQEIADDQNWAKWEDNTVQNGIKAGGPMLNGEELAEYYISYRHPSWKRSSYLAVFQHDEQSPVLYKVKAHDGDEMISETSEQAVVLFSDAIKTR